MSTVDPQAPRHSLIEDIFAIVVGTLLVSFGIAMFKQAGLLTGSTAGLAFLTYYVTGIPFGVAFFVINLPFYYLAFMRMGWRFTVKTFCAVGLVSAMSETHTHFISFAAVDPFYTGLLGGLIMGVGFLALFRHQASLGGVNILALYVQDRYGIRAGKLQMAIDLTILAVSYFVIDGKAMLASVVGAVAINAVIWMNHRRDRYVAWSAP
ncbi:MAG: YitT family protein [Rhodopseudomonas sp.]|nr:YitT family protein [Rhodopseudomonas sp.]